MDDDLDFSNPAPAKPAAPLAAPPARAEALPYDAQLAGRFFRLAGEQETFEAGATVFAEQEKAAGFFSRRARMYLLVEGQVALTLKGKPLHLVLPGETFGELAIISDAPRSATAKALRKSLVLSLDEKRFLASLPQEPEFALMLVGVLATQMRRGIERLVAAKPGALVPRAGGAGLDPEQLGKLRLGLGDPMPTPMRAGDTIVNQGAMGVYMYVMMSGRVAISVDGTLVEQIGAGETFGEIAMLGSTARGATATAEADGAWLPVPRDAFIKIVRAHPVVGIALLRSMSERVQHLNAQMHA